MSRLLSLPLQEDTFSLMIIIAAAAAAEHDEPQSRPVPSRPLEAQQTLSQSVSEI